MQIQNMGLNHNEPISWVDFKPPVKNEGSVI